jgi:hypothetical protein
MPVLNLKDRAASIDVGHGIVKGSGAAIARVFSETCMEERGDGEHLAGCEARRLRQPPKVAKHKYLISCTTTVMQNPVVAGLLRIVRTVKTNSSP